MLAVLSSGLLLAPGAARAQTTTDFRIVSDPLFLPLKGQLYGMTSDALSMPHGDNFKAGVQTGSFNASDNHLDQTLALGLANRLTVRAAFGYSNNERDSTAAATGDVTTGNASGWTDPTVSLTYRVLDEPRAPLIFDLTAVYSPDVLTAKTAGGGSDGTVARGGQTTGVSVAVGRVLKRFTVAATAEATYVGQQTTELLSNGTSTESDAHWSYDAGFATQTRFTDRISIDAGVAYGTAGNYGVANMDKGNSHTFEPPSTCSLNAALNYHLRPNRFVASLNYSYVAYTDAQSIFAKSTSDTSVENRRANVIGFRLMYTFK